MTRWWCERCGMVRDAERAPICRHGDPMLPAVWMRFIPKTHPLATGPLQ